MSAARALVTRKNEGTNYPWWFIVAGNRKTIDSPMRIEGPFFSREAAEEQRKARIYAYGEKSYVWCAGGSESDEYTAAVDAAVKAIREESQS
jgi:hypothetical protein